METPNKYGYFCSVMGHFQFRCYSRSLESGGFFVQRKDIRYGKAIFISRFSGSICLRNEVSDDGEMQLTLTFPVISDLLQTVRCQVVPQNNAWARITSLLSNLLRVVTVSDWSPTSFSTIHISIRSILPLQKHQKKNLSLSTWYISIYTSHIEFSVLFSCLFLYLYK